MADDSINNSIVDYINTMSQSTEETLRSIDLTLKAIAKGDGLLISQSSLKDLAEQERQVAQNASRIRNDNTSRNQNSGRYRISGDADIDQETKKKAKVTFSKLFDDFDDEITKALFGSSKPFEDTLRKSITGFAKSLGTTTDKLGEELGKRVSNIIKQGRVIGPIANRLAMERNWISNRATGFVENRLNGLSARLGGTGNINLSELFEEDRTNESPQVGDIDSIVNSNVSDLQNTVVENINVLKEQLQAETEQNSEANTERINSILEAIESLRQLLDSTSEESSGNSLTDIVEGSVNSAEAGQGAADAFDVAGDAVNELTGGMGDAVDVVTDVAGEAFPSLSLALGAAGVAFDVLTDVFGADIQRIQKSFSDFGQSLQKVMFRSTANNAEFMKAQQDRMKADQEALVKASFNVIEESANKVEQVWDNILTTVSATQGYDKAGVQDLWSSYAQRLTDAGLASFVSSADIMEKLESVLQQGLSGAVAEEFAYQATLLSNAIPTEDFFQYASTYASIAANAIKNGVSQERAITIANNELTQFANNLLYASREIAGGFTTSLSNASSLFEQSAKIAMTSRTGDISNISGVLTSVSAIVGAVAPDLASSLVDTVVRATTGGNSSDITALRSMAGVGASNTAFLQEFAKDPQKIFVTLFQNLAKLQNMSADNYMEVAEGLSQVFGISMDAFARVDFDHLATAISEMNLHSDELNKNMDLLVKGETTSTASQLRMQQINEYMVEQGLAYVLDNEVARSIQEHMWQEQLFREVTESLLNVDLKGKALELLDSILSFVRKIGDLVNPSAWAKRIEDLTISIAEANEPNSEVVDNLEEFVVGSGNARSFRQLTTVGDDLGIADDIYDKLTGTRNLFEVMGLPKDTTTFKGNAESNYTYRMVGKQQAEQSWAAALVNKAKTSLQDAIDSIKKALFDKSNKDKETVAQQKAAANTLSEKLSSSIKGYKLNADSSLISVVSSSLKENLNNSLIKRDLDILTDQGEVLHRSFLTDSEISQKVAEQMATLQQGTMEGTFEHWLEEFQKDSGYTDLEAELAKYGQSLDVVEAMFEQQQAANSAAATKARQLHEVQFWEDMQNFATVDFPWYMREWERYYIQHEAYNEATGGVGEGKGAYQAAVELRAQEQGEFGDSVFALAKALTENKNWQEELGDKLKEPAVQTNALLAQILLLVDAIRQQNNDTAIVSVPTALSALGLGTVNK